MTPSTLATSTSAALPLSTRLAGFWGLMKVRLNSLVLFAVAAGYILASPEVPPSPTC